ncbi:unnamed protein product [Bursaphelenchus okinawaensis]|uniref:3-hydroxyacyl-CoA dehydrogenase n=1 Tax=Bursaphelenchus okinawaensis TaxID=465554 RepID=A0A811KFT7_9BILA|nr:unnamed protein product [Bursaphelenchus okinawaensis]CAG9103663.1 unnamed protein product [Bursaphelenchus okinawaensis]
MLRLCPLSNSLNRFLSTGTTLGAPVQNVTIIGSGLMGSGIAQVSAQAKLNVVLVDQNEKILNAAQQRIHKSLQRVAKKKHGDNESEATKFVDDTLGKIKINSDLRSAVKEADLVIEAIVENIEAKQKLFSEVEKAAKSDVILATNTSSLRLADIGANIKNQANFGGLHFFNPVPVMKLLEVVKHDKTSEQTFKELEGFGKTVGKVTVACKDTPGFIVNRLLVPYMYEALRLAERGDASMKDIDVAMKLGAGYPMGPFELADYVGLDTLKFIQDGWAKQHPDDPLFKPSQLLNKLVSEGKLGAKSGEGFYKYNIVLKRSEPVFFPGEVVDGYVLIKSREPIKAREIAIAISGKAKSTWTMWEQYSANRSTKSEAVPYWAEIIYIDLVNTLWTPPPTSSVLPAGENKFPFSFLLPSNAPPTFEGKVGYIRYFLRVKIERPWLFDYKAFLGFTVTPHFDLTSLSYASLPIFKTVCKQLGTLWFKHGTIEVKINLSKSGYVPGESVVLHVDVKNNTSKDIQRIESSLVQYSYYTAHRHATRLHYGHAQNKDIEHKTESRIVVQYVEEYKIPKKSSGSYKRMLAIPPVVPSFNVCDIIQVGYYFKIKIVAIGKISNTVSDEVPVLIGTVPSRPSICTNEPPERDYLAPPQPSLEIEKSDQQFRYADCLFGKGLVPDDEDDKIIDYTPRYIYYSNIP